MLLFKDIKQNYPIYILDKQGVKFSHGKVTAVSFPRVNQTPMTTFNTANMPMVVDVTVDVDGKVATYTIPENLSVTYAGNLVLSTEKEGLIKEVEAMKTAAEQVLNSVEHQKEIVEKSSELLTELNPIFKEKQDTEKRFNKIENDVSEMKTMLTSFIREFKQ